MMLVSIDLTTMNQKNAHELITPYLNHYYQTSHYSIQVGTQDFENIYLLWPLLAGKEIKLFFYTSLKTLRIWYQCKGPKFALRST